MKNRLVVLALGSLLALGAVPALAENMAGQAPKKTVTGELVDTGCYLGHEAKGAKHVSCATKCIAQGMPMGLLTSNGTLYLITLDHENADPYNRLKTMAGKTVTVTGNAFTRSGMKALVASEVKAAS